VLLANSIRSSGARPGEASTLGDPPLAIPLVIFMTTQKPIARGSNNQQNGQICRTSPNLDWI